MTQAVMIDRRAGTVAAGQLDTLLQTPEPRRLFALADGGEIEKTPSADDVSPGKVADTVKKARSVETLRDKEAALMRRREQIRTLRKAAQAAPSPQLFLEELQRRAGQAEQLHADVLSSVLELTRPLEVLAWEHYSFFAGARIPACDALLRGSVALVALDAEGLLEHPLTGTSRFLGPLAGIGNVHTDVYGLLVAAGELTLNEEVVRMGAVAGGHSSLAYVSIPVPSLENVEQLRKNKEGEENVVLTCVPIRVRRASAYEASDVVISGAFAAAGMEVFKTSVSLEHGLGSSVTGNQEQWTLSDAFALYDEKGPLVEDFGKGRVDQMPECVLVGASMTNPYTERTSNVNLHGNHTARAAQPTFQIPVRQALNHLRRKLKIHGYRLLVDEKSREREMRKVEGELRFELVGPAPKPFSKLDLVEDRDSAEGQAALAKGGVVLKGVATINKRTEFVHITILPVS